VDHGVLGELPGCHFDGRPLPDEGPRHRGGRADDIFCVLRLNWRFFSTRLLASSQMAGFSAAVADLHEVHEVAFEHVESVVFWRNGAAPSTSGGPLPPERWGRAVPRRPAALGPTDPSSWQRCGWRTSYRSKHGGGGPLFPQSGHGKKPTFRETSSFETVSWVPCRRRKSERISLWFRARCQPFSLIVAWTSDVTGL
jgi:hypothetical protein